MSAPLGRCCSSGQLRDEGVRCHGVPLPRRLAAWAMWASLWAAACVASAVTPARCPPLLDPFDGLPSELPTPEQMARMYGIPRTPSPRCSTSYGKRGQSTTVGWIPARREGGAPLPPTPIPRVVLQTWKSSVLDERVCRAAVAWSEINPEFDYLLFNDTHARELIRINYGERLAASWDCIAVGALKADVWRLLAVYAHGGYYFDMDAGPKREHPFRTWGTGNLTMVSGVGKRVREPHQWGLVYAPRHPLLHLAIQIMVPLLALRSQKRVQNLAYAPFQRAYLALKGRYSTVPGWGDCFGGRVHFKIPGGFDQHLRKSGGEQHWSAVEMHGGRLWHNATCC